jgi:hypothetical protein
MRLRPERNCKLQYLIQESSGSYIAFKLMATCRSPLATMFWMVISGSVLMSILVCAMAFAIPDDSSSFFYFALI